jgi:hypothetical protein
VSRHRIFDHGPIWFDWINRRHWMLDIRLPARWHVSASRWHNRTCHTPQASGTGSAPACSASPPERT